MNKNIHENQNNSMHSSTATTASGEILKLCFIPSIHATATSTQIVIISEGGILFYDYKSKCAQTILNSEIFSNNIMNVNNYKNFPITIAFTSSNNGVIGCSDGTVR